MAESILESVIRSQYLDTGDFDVFVKIPDPYNAGPGSLLVESVSGANSFLVQNGALTTPELTITAHVTKKQDSLLRHLYVATVHPGYIDERYPITVEWGDTSSVEYAKPSSTADGLLDANGMNAHEFYLASYTPSETVSFSSADFLPVSIVLRLI